METFHRFSPNTFSLIPSDILINSFDAALHPNVVSRKNSQSSTEREVSTYFSSGVSQSGFVSLLEFVNFHFGISLSIEDDEDFELFVRNSWQLTSESQDFSSPSSSFLRPTFSASGASSRRVLVNKKDGSFEVVELSDEVTGGKFDMLSVTNRLHKQGMNNVSNVRIN